MDRRILPIVAVTSMFAIAALPSAEALPTPETYCMWNPTYTDPVEAASDGRVEFRDGRLCTVYVRAPGSLIEV